MATMDPKEIATDLESDEDEDSELSEESGGRKEDEDDLSEKSDASIGWITEEGIVDVDAHLVRDPYTEVGRVHRAQIMEMGGVQYLLGPEVGGGSFAAVYEVLRMDTLKRLALKECRVRQGFDRQHRLGFIRREVLIQKYLQGLRKHSADSRHQEDRAEYILHGLAWGHDPPSRLSRDEHIYIVCELCVGTIYDLVASRDHRKPIPLPERQAHRYTHEILSGLEFLHSHHVIHGDLKCDNFFISFSGHIRLGDFNSAQRLSPFDLDGSTWVCHGAEDYRPPEVIESYSAKSSKGEATSSEDEDDDDDGSLNISGTALTSKIRFKSMNPLEHDRKVGDRRRRAGVPPFQGYKMDMWSLGVALYVAYTGRYPFRMSAKATTNPLERDELILQVKYRPIGKRRDGCSPSMGSLLQMLLVKDPRGRASIDDLRRESIWLSLGWTSGLGSGGGLSREYSRKAAERDVAVPLEKGQDAYRSTTTMRAMYALHYRETANRLAGQQVRYEQFERHLNPSFNLRPNRVLGSASGRERLAFHTKKPLPF